MRTRCEEVTILHIAYAYVKSDILELDNKTENYYNYNAAECPNTGFDKFLFSLKIIRIRDNQQKEKKKGRRETMTRRRIKSEFVCINCTQFIGLKIQK